MNQAWPVIIVHPPNMAAGLGWACGPHWSKRLHTIILDEKLGKISSFSAGITCFEDGTSEYYHVKRASLRLKLMQKKSQSQIFNSVKSGQVTSLDILDAAVIETISIPSHFSYICQAD